MVGNCFFMLNLLSFFGGDKIKNNKMKIQVAQGIGNGKTLLSAFDAALKDAGVYNYNIIKLSSVIPPNSVIEKVENYITPDGEWGHRLYVVESNISSDEKGKALAAGVGWYQLEDGRGVFVEHKTIEASEEEARSKVEGNIRNSLSDLCSFRGITFDESKVNMSISSVVVKDLSACALVVAVYKAEGWQ